MNEIIKNLRKNIYKNNIMNKSIAKSQNMLLNGTFLCLKFNKPTHYYCTNL